MFQRANANFSELIHPAKARLASTPTPVTPLNELNKEIPVRISIKRDDLISSYLAGSEVRALEYLLHEAKVQKVTSIITCGKVNSALIRAISIAARQLGFRDVHVFLLGPPPSSIDEGSLFLTYMSGSKIYYLSEEQYANRDRIMNRLARSLDAMDDNAMIIQDYLSQPSALWGYISMIKEMVDTHNKFPYTHVFLPASTGITLAGILVARSMLKLRFHVVAFNVAGDTHATLTARINRSIAAFNTQYGCNYAAGSYILSDDYVGPGGPGMPYPEEIYWVQRLARIEGVFLDPITTGKAFYGLMDQAVKKLFTPSDSVLFVHTGNPFALLDSRAHFAFPHATPALDGAIVDVSENVKMTNGDGEEGQRFELDMEEDYEPSIKLIRK